MLSFFNDWFQAVEVGFFLSSLIEQERRDYLQQLRADSQRLLRGAILVLIFLSNKNSDKRCN